MEHAPEPSAAAEELEPAEAEADGEAAALDGLRVAGRVLTVPVGCGEADSVVSSSTVGVDAAVGEAEVGAALVEAEALGDEDAAPLDVGEDAALLAEAEASGAEDVPEESEEQPLASSIRAQAAPAARAGRRRRGEKVSMPPA